MRHYNSGEHGTVVVDFASVTPDRNLPCPTAMTQLHGVIDYSQSRSVWKQAQPIARKDAPLRAAPRLVFRKPRAPLGNSRPRWAQRRGLAASPLPPRRGGLCLPCPPVLVAP